MVNRYDRFFPNYPDDSDFTTNAPSYYEHLGRKTHLIKLLAKRIWEYENTLNESLEQIEKRLTDYISKNDTLMNERLENWDNRIEEMPEEMGSLFVEWLNDGTLEQIINHDVLGNKADTEQLTQSINEYNTLSFDIIGDGESDQTSEIKDLLSLAKNNKRGVYFNDGIYKITDNLDVSGVSIRGNNVVLDFSDYDGEECLSATGSRQTLFDNVSLIKGDYTFGSYVDVKKGDIISITSSESIPNTQRSTYYKGGTHYVESYDTETKKVTIHPPFDFDYSNATIEKITPARVDIGDGVEVRGNPDKPQRGLVMKDSLINLSGSFRNFGLNGVIAESCFGVFSGFIRDTYLPGGNTNYGLVIGSGSHIHVMGAEIWGGRHSLASGGNFPSRITVSGGYFVGRSEGSSAVDAHGSVKDFIVNGAIIDGGLQTSADNSLITNNIIYFQDKTGITSNNDNNSKEWGTTKISNNMILSRGTQEKPTTSAGINCFGSAKSVEISGNTIEGHWGGSSDSYAVPLNIATDTDYLRVRNNKLKKESNAGGITSRIAIQNSEADVVIEGNTILNHSLQIRPSVSGCTVVVKGNKSNKSNSNGIQILGYSDRLFKDVIVWDNVITNSNFSGIVVDYSEQTSIKNNKSKVVGLGSTVPSNSSGASIRNTTLVNVQGNEFNEGNLGLHLSSVLKAMINNNNLLDNTTAMYVANVEILSRLGNVTGDNNPDLIKGSNGQLYRFDGESFVVN